MKNLVFFFHAHLPFVKHPESNFDGRDNYQEVWFYEAVLEVYLPMLYVIEKLDKRHGKNKIKFNINFSPTIIDMLVNPYFKERFDKYLENTENLAKEELARTDNLDNFYGCFRDRLGEQYEQSIVNPIFCKEIKRN